MIEPARQQDLNDRPERPGEYVLYWMQQSQRERFNPALETAVGCANRLGLPVLVGFGLTDGYPDANARHYAFMLDGLADVGAALARRGIGFAVLRGSPEAVAIALARKAALVVCDRGYLRHQKTWRTALAEAAACRVIQIEGDVVVPVDLASGKQEIAARTLRPKILKVRDEFVRPLPRTPVKVKADSLSLPKALDLSDTKRLLAKLDIDRSVLPVDRFKGGSLEASRRLRAFVRGGLAGYADGRSEPAREQVSFLSAYLHFGQISPVEIALEVSEANADRPDAAAYLEELIVRRELAINFVEHEPRYDSYACLPEWARRTLRAPRNRSPPPPLRRRAARGGRDARSLLERRDARDGVHRLHAQLHAHVLGKEDPGMVADAGEGILDGARPEQPLLPVRSRSELLRRRRLVLRSARPAMAGTPDLRQGAFDDGIRSRTQVRY